MKFKNGDRVHVTRLNGKNVDFYATLVELKNENLWELVDCSDSKYKDDDVYKENVIGFGVNEEDYYTLAIDEEDSEKPEIQYIDKKEEMIQYIEFKDYEVDETNKQRTAIERLNEFKLRHPSARVVGYNTEVFENMNNRERTYILVEYNYMD